jgi:hypothetical protein
LRDELTNLEKREEEGSLPASLLDTKTFIQTELLRVIEEEELYWHKRSNQNWLLQGQQHKILPQICQWQKRKI